MGFLIIEVYHSITQFDTWQFILNIHYGLLLLSILILSFFIFCTSSLWALIVKKIDNNVEYRDCLAAYNLSLLAKYLPGGIWNLVGRALYLHKKGVSVAVTSSSIVYEFFFLITSSVTIGGFLLIEHNVVSIGAILLIYIGMLCFLFWPNTVIVILNKVLVLLKRETLSCRLSRANVLIIFLLFVLSWGIYGFAFQLLIQAMNLEFTQSLLYLLAILANSWVIGYLSPTPGGIGVREGIMTFLLGKTSVSTYAALISVVSRLWFICAELLIISIVVIAMAIQNSRGKERPDEQGVSV